MSEKDTQTSDAAYGAVLDETDHQAKYQSATINTRREQEVRIQALGAALSRRDWHATERAYEAIRDHFDRTPDSRPAQEQKSQAKEPRQSGDNSGTDPSRPRTAVRVGEPTRIGAVVGDQVAEEPSSVSPQEIGAVAALEPFANIGLAVLKDRPGWANSSFAGLWAGQYELTYTDFERAAAVAIKLRMAQSQEENAGKIDV